MTETTKKDLEVAEKRTVEKTEGEPTREGLMYLPQVDILEDDQAITLRADMPGVKKDDVDIDVREGILSLTGTVADVQEGWNQIYREYDVGGFSRRFTLGEQIDTDKINATMENGVLTVVLPKAEQHKPRKVQIG